MLWVGNCGVAVQLVTGLFTEEVEVLEQFLVD